MVSPACFPLTEVRKLPGRSVAFYSPPYQERRGSGYSYSDSQGSNMSDRDGGSDSQQRKRIAVACGRCRKRKIRCSGDNGTGQPCTNCRNAGHDPCQFLREAHMRGEGGFSYGLDASRHYQARGSSSMMPPLPQAMSSPYVDGIQMPAADALQYRGGSSSYAYGAGAGGSKPYYAMHDFNSHGYPDDTAAGVDYSMYPPSCAPVHDPGYMVNYRLGSNATPAKPSTAMYVDTDAAAAAYAYGPGSAPGTPGTHNRPVSTAAADAGSFSFQNVAAGLSNSLTTSGGGGADRSALPVPNRRPLPSAAPRPYRADSISSAFSKHSQPSSGGTASPPSPAVHEGSAAGGYGAFDGTSAGSYHAAGSLGSSSQLRGSGSSSGDLYTTTASDTLLHGSGGGSGVRMSAGAGPELTYRYQDTTTRRGTSASLSGLGIGSSQYLHQGQGQNGASSFVMAAGDLGGADHGAAADGERKSLAGLRS